MTAKNCTQCREFKPLKDFYESNANKDGLQYHCKTCDHARSKARKRTKKGLVSTIYFSQRASSKRRGHKMPNYCQADLREWMFSQPNFNEMYNNWTDSGHSRMLSPSCDRIDDDKPYSFPNLQFMTWQENFDKYHNDTKNNKKSKPILQLTLTNDLVKRHHSACKASRDTGVNQGSISRCCNRTRLKTCGGFRWIFSIA